MVHRVDLGCAKRGVRATDRAERQGKRAGASRGRRDRLRER